MLGTFHVPGGQSAKVVGTARFVEFGIGGLHPPILQTAEQDGDWPRLRRNPAVAAPPHPAVAAPPQSSRRGAAATADRWTWRPSGAGGEDAVPAVAAAGLPAWRMHPRTSSVRWSGGLVRPAHGPGDPAAPWSRPPSGLGGLPLRLGRAPERTLGSPAPQWVRPLERDSPGRRWLGRGWPGQAARWRRTRRLEWWRPQPSQVAPFAEPSGGTRWRSRT